MSVDEIKQLPVADLAENNAHLYLWATNRYLEDAFSIVRAWGFKPSTTLVWAKTPIGGGMGGAFGITTEFVIFARRGILAAKSRAVGTWYQWKRPYENGHLVHSRKPAGMQDLVEQISPGPYLELFARRQRIGWDTWGNEALEHVSF